MVQAAARGSREVFAANRAAGRIALSVAAQGGVTRRREVYEDGPLRVRFPNVSGDALEAMIVSLVVAIDRVRADAASSSAATM